MRDALSPAERAAIAAYRGPIQRIPMGTYTDEIRNRHGKVIGRKLVEAGEVAPWRDKREKEQAKRRAARG